MTPPVKNDGEAGESDLDRAVLRVTQPCRNAHRRSRSANRIIDEFESEVCSDEEITATTTLLAYIRFPLFRKEGF